MKKYILYTIIHLSCLSLRTQTVISPNSIEKFKIGGTTFTSFHLNANQPFEYVAIYNCNGGQITMLSNKELTSQNYTVSTENLPARFYSIVPYTEEY